MADVVRYDRNEWPDKAELTADGFLRVDAPITRMGVLKYQNADGSTRGELRHPDDWSTPVALDALRSLPVTNDHPPPRASDGQNLVDAKSAKRLAIGWNEQVRADGKYLRSPIVILDEDGIAAVRRGRRGTSTGVLVELREESGEYEGESYQFRQIPRRGNHIAIVDSPRAGTMIRLDGNQAPEGDQDMSDRKLPTVKLDGIDYEAQQEVLNALSKAQGEKNTLQAKLDAADTKHKAELDKVTADRDSLKEKLDAAEKRDIKAEVKARVALETSARSILPEDDHEKLDSMTDQEIRKAVVLAASPEAKLDGKSDDYIQARFDKALEDHAAGRTDEQQRADALAAQRAKVTPKLDASNQSEEIKRELYRIQNQWRPDFDPKGYAA